VVMFVLSRRFGALADRFGPRFFMGAGPLVGAAGIRNPRKEEEEIRAQSCPGGQLVGASSEIGWEGAGEPAAQPTGSRA
jgi:hypothetical protein